MKNNLNKCALFERIVLVISKTSSIRHLNSTCVDLNLGCNIIQDEGTFIKSIELGILHNVALYFPIIC